MRKILFRGKSADGEWVYGDVRTHAPSGEIMIAGKLRLTDVIPETVGMFVSDSITNAEIFENDIICFSDLGGEHFGIVKFGKYSVAGSENIGFYVNWIDSSDNDYFRQDLGWWLKKPSIEIVGNIYDNKELIENA